MSRKNAGLLAGLGGASVAAALWYIHVVRPWHLRWGATDAEINEELPGDSIVPHPKAVSTHAITIHSPVETVWAWLVQIGQDKGGFYSYDWLENAVGCHLHNANRIEPQFQHLHLGGSVRLHPLVPPLPVLRLEPERALVLGSNTNDPGTWGFYLKPLDDNTTRLLIRSRGDFDRGILPWVIRYLLFEPIHFVMERKMMLGIRARAEGKMCTCGHCHQEEPRQP
jgi:hypothetical protein